MPQTKLQGEDRPIRIYVEKDEAAKQAKLVFDDDGSAQTAMTFEVDRSTRRLFVTVDAHAKGVVFANAEITAAPAQYDHNGPDGPFGIKRNWKVEDGKFIVWLPNGSEISVPVHPTPGSRTPRGMQEIYGQNNLLFRLVHGIVTGKNVLISGPTGTGKTAILKWLCEKLNWNFVFMACSRSTESAHLIGEYQPTGDVAAPFMWSDGPVTTATRLSQTHPTLLLFDEGNRIGNVAEFARIYSLLDDQKVLELPEKRSEEDGTVVAAAEEVKAGKLMVVMTQNSADDAAADYIGVQELDPAFKSRFPIKPAVTYPHEDVEVAALRERVPTTPENVARAMVKAANKIRAEADLRYPISFRELEAWAASYPYYGYQDGAEDTVVASGPAGFETDIRNLLRAQGV